MGPVTTSGDRLEVARGGGLEVAKAARGGLEVVGGCGIGTVRGDCVGVASVGGLGSRGGARVGQAIWRGLNGNVLARHVYNINRLARRY